MTNEDISKLIEELCAAETWEGFPFVIGADIPIDTIEEVFENQLLSKFRTRFERDGGLRPVGFVFAQNAPGQPAQKVESGQARHLILGASGDFDEPEKQAFSRAIRLLAWKTDAVAVVFASEAWALSRSEEGFEEFKAFSGRLNEHPDHVEVLMVHFEQEGRQVYYHAQIHRDENNSATLGPWEHRAEQLTGRFTSFILRNAAHSPTWATHGWGS